MASIADSGPGLTRRMDARAALRRARHAPDCAHHPHLLRGDHLSARRRRSISRSSRSSRRRSRDTGSASTTTPISSSSSTFWNALRNNLIWTAGTLSLQIVAGVALALLLNNDIVFRSLARSLVLFPVFRLDRRGGACLALAVQRPLRNPQPLHASARPDRHADQLARPDAERHDQRDPGGGMEVFPLRRHRRPCAAADDSAAAL